MENNEPLKPSGQDYRYAHVQSIWRVGDVKSLHDMLEIIPRTIVAKDLGWHYHTFLHRVDNPELFTLEHLIALSRLTGIEVSAMMEIVVADILAKDSTKPLSHEKA